MNYSENLMSIKNLSINFETYAGTVHSVRDINFEIFPGETLALVGESGSGKSVTARSLMALHSPGKVLDGGEIFFEGNNILEYSDQELNDYRGNGTSMIFQDALVSLNPTMKIGKQIAENLINHSDLNKNEVRSKCIKVLQEVGFADPELQLEKFPHELSGGMRQRVMIAMAIITKPKLLIADEPTTALDVTIQAQILELLKDLQEDTGMAILLITHDMGVVASMADRVNVMYAGQIVEGGKVNEIFYNRQHPYTWALLNSVPRIDLSNKQKLVSIEGSLPDTINPPKGCAFYNRCPYAMKVCEKYDPEVSKLSEIHRVRCWLQDERANTKDLSFSVGGAIDE